MSVVDDVKSRIDLVELVSETVKLRKSGRTFTGLCPFHAHKNNTPSFAVWPESGNWRCFGQCNEGGDAFVAGLKLGVRVLINSQARGIVCVKLAAAAGGRQLWHLVDDLGCVLVAIMGVAGWHSGWRSRWPLFSGSSRFRLSSSRRLLVISLSTHHLSRCR